jgi:hypothetical protein
MHFHVYTSRVPGAQANGSPESEPDHPGFRTSTVPPRLTRRWLMRDQARVKAKHFDTADDAAKWLAAWIEENPRPDSAYFPDEPQAEQRSRKVEFARRMLAGGNDVVEGFYTGGGEFMSASLIACPPRTGQWRCPKP